MWTQAVWLEYKVIEMNNTNNTNNNDIIIIIVFIIIIIIAIVMYSLKRVAQHAHSAIWLFKGYRNIGGLKLWIGAKQSKTLQK